VYEFFLLSEHELNLFHVELVPDPLDDFGPGSYRIVNSLVSDEGPGLLRDWILEYDFGDSVSGILE
jgi:hypothetical protein